MLIICSGPDTYHARKKARELVSAFRAKHDPTGYSTEVIDVDATRALSSVLERIGSSSLFAQKRLIRCDGFLEDLKIADVRTLAKRLEADNEQTIVLSFENEPISSKYEQEFEKIKLVHYSFPLLFGAKFAAAVSARAQQLGVISKVAEEIARDTASDMWLAESELQKCSAYLDAPRIHAGQVEKNIFEAAESFLIQRHGWRVKLESVDEPEAAPSIFLSQARTFVRVADGETKNVHPYAVRKFSSLRLPVTRRREALLGSMQAFVASRQGYSSGSEANALL